MENLELILSLIGTTGSLLITCIIFIVKFVNSLRTKRLAEDDTEILEAILPLMEIAEKYENYSGEEKKEYVLTKLNQFAIENGIAFNTEAVIGKIEELIQLTKQVNTNKITGVKNEQ